MLATRFIIALCPATPIYLVKFDVPAKRIFSRHAATISTETTRVKGEALVFDTFEAAMEVAKDITGWGGAQRVEQVAVEVEDTRVTLDTPEARIEVRDNATAQYTAAREAGYAERNAAEEVAAELRSVGLKVGVDYRDAASTPVSLNLADHLGNLLTLDWDPMQDGFSYETEGDDACDIGETEAQHEAEPDTVTCDGCGADDAEPCGDSDGHAFCAACRAKSQAEPTKAKAQARAERKAERAALTIIGSAPRFVEAPIIPADAAPGSEGIFKALLGLTTERKIVALVNALHFAGVAIHRVEEDGEPIIRASTLDRGTATVLNL